MEPVSAAFGVIAVIPQCISSAKELYDLRSRYKDASILITAIYSESMVIAASLSQVQTLLQRDALKDKPQLHETFDRALTGCRVVYGCLEEEVRDLAAKANDDKLRFKDRAKYLWKEDTFKELLQQIRGQQSALSLLIQGLQMESISDIKSLVEDNSARLDQVAKRSKTLRQSHPRIKVPDSIFDNDTSSQISSDASTLLNSVQFAFDDEIVNSTAYRRAMELASLHAEGKAADSEPHHAEDDLIHLYSTHGRDIGQGPAVSQATSGLKSLDLNPDPANEGDNVEQAHLSSVDQGNSKRHSDLLNSLERNMLPFMPPAPVTSTPAIVTHEPAEDTHLACQSSASSSLSTSIGTVSSDLPAHTVTVEEISQHQRETGLLAERPPALPPRRSSRPQPCPEVPIDLSEVAHSISSDDLTSVPSVPSFCSRDSMASSSTLTDTSQDDIFMRGRLTRKPLPLSHKASGDRLNNDPTELTVSSRVAPLEDANMHNIWVSLVADEEMFIDRMTKFKKIFYDTVIKEWPLLEKHLEVIAMGEQLAQRNAQYLLEPMKAQVSQTSEATCSPSNFEAWASETHKLYRDYCQRLPHAEGAIRTTLKVDSKFSPFIGMLGLSIVWFGKAWDDYLKLPLLQLDIYTDRLESLAELAGKLATPAATGGEVRLRRALGIVQRLKQSCVRLMEESQSREDLQSLHRRIFTMDSIYVSQLNLFDTARRIRFQGGMAIKVNGQGPWHAIHVVLLDNFLLWGKVKPPGSWKQLEAKHSKGGNIWMFEAPISLFHLDVALPDKDRQFQKATLLDDIPRGSVLYQIFIKDKLSTTKAHILGAYSVDTRKEWLDHLNAAIVAHHAVSMGQ